MLELVSRFVASESQRSELRIEEVASGRIVGTAEEPRMGNQGGGRFAQTS